MLQVFQVVDRREPILGYIERLNQLVVFQAFDFLDAILANVQLGEARQFVQVLDLGDPVRLNRQTLQFDQLVEILDFLDFVLSQVEMGQIDEGVQILDGLQHKTVNSELRTERAKLTLNRLSPSSSIVIFVNVPRFSILEILFAHKNSFCILTNLPKFLISVMRLKLKSRILEINSSKRD